jgi:hypothetical protein
LIGAEAASEPAGPEVSEEEVRGIEAPGSPTEPPVEDSARASEQGASALAGAEALEGDQPVQEEPPEPLAATDQRDTLSPGAESAIQAQVREGDETVSDAETQQAEEERPVSEPSPSEMEKEALHGEARRFARLLVAEIKLYNEEDVVQGRDEADLYARLKEDIDRSREMYERRAHPLVRAETDYFDEELVRVLSLENRDLMGEDYPGPQTEQAGDSSAPDF